MSKTTTKKSAAKATTKKPAGAGGSKGQEIIRLVTESGKAGTSRTAIAEQVGCTVQRVGEVFRAHGGVSKIGPKLYAITGASKAVERKAANKAAAASKKAGNSELDNYKAVIAGDTSADFDAAVAYAKRTKKRVPKAA